MAAPISIKQILAERGLLANIVLSPGIDELLGALETPPEELRAVDDRIVGAVTLAGKKKLGLLALDLVPPPTPMAFLLICDPALQSFRFWLVLSSLKLAEPVFSFVSAGVEAVFKPAQPDPADPGRLIAAGGEVRILGAAVAVLIEGKAGESATLRLSPTVGQPPGIIELQLAPPTVFIGGTGFGLEFPGSAGKPGAFVIDDATDAAPAGETILNGARVATRADDPAWRGISVRHARLYIPPGVPWLGGHAVDAFVEVGTEPGEGIDLAVSTHIPADGDRPRIDVNIECRDSSATGLQDFVPTLVELAMELPLDGRQEDGAPGGGFRFSAGKPVVARLRFARSVGEGTMRLTFAIEAQGPDGVLSVMAPGGGPAARVLITAAALATAIVADKAPEGADTGGVVLHELLVAALGLSSCLKDQGRLTIHKVELSSSGHGLPVGEEVKFLVDYSVDVSVRPIDVGALSVQMRDAQPMRVRNRNVALRIDLSRPAASALQTVKLDFSAADIEIEDPGGWMVNSPGSLFDILGTRSGRGSTWLEVDLRFKLNLGPIRVSGATIRATLSEEGQIVATLRGLDATLLVPGVVEGEGGLELLDGGGLAAALEVRLPPLNLAAGGSFLYQPHGDSFLLFVKIDFDLPGPIPIANTGLGIYGVSGAFGINARPKPPRPDEADPVGYQLRWDPAARDAFEFRADNLTVGAQAVFGTLPDLGFSFSGRAGLFVTVPDVVVRGSLWATVMSPRMRVSDRPDPDGQAGLSFMGVVVVDPAEGVTIGLKGELTVPVLLHVVVPLGAHFPTGADESDNWFVYLGADGCALEGRGMGPMRAEVLPDILRVSADAYFMVRGRGIHQWPRGGSISVEEGLVLAFGFGFEYSVGVPGLVWAEVHASADILIATRPLTLAGFGTAGGSLNLGPFSIGVDAMLSFVAIEQADPYLHARLCGHIDLFFTEIEGCVEVSINNEPTLQVPPPDVHPLDDVQNGVAQGDLAFLIDDQYRRIGSMPRDPDSIAPEDSVWCDALLHLSFAVAPKLAPGYVAASGGTPQFSGIEAYPSGLAAQPVGSEMLRYEWTLRKLALFDVTDDPEPHVAGTLVTGPFMAAWQSGKDGDLGVRPQAGDLVLLTYQDDLSLARHADAGVGLPHDPMFIASKACQAQVTARVGWAVGYDAQPDDNTYVLPSDPLAPDPCVSRFTATLTQSMSELVGVSLGMSSAALMPPPFDFEAAELDVFTPALELERPFAGALALGVVGAPRLDDAAFQRVLPVQTAVLTPQVPLEQARLWVIFDGVVPEQGALPVAVVDDREQSWAVTGRREVEPGRTALRFAPRDPRFVTSVRLSWKLSSRLAILGLGGVTAAAQAAAQLRQARTRAEAQRQADVARTQPHPPDKATGSDVRGLLKPGRLYRLDMEMTWDGWLFTQAENGSKTLAAELLAQDTYQPKGGVGTKTHRTYYFRTTATPREVPGLAVELPKYGTGSHLAAIRRRVDLFDPKMLSRFLLGYVPTQTETARFRDDPLSAHFSRDHVAALAQLYGYELTVDLRRVDLPGEGGEPIELESVWVGLERPELLSMVDKRRFDVASAAPCALPRPGATLKARHEDPLAPEAWYEVYALAKSLQPDAVVDGRLDGVTFRTSRFRNPAEMLAGIGFTPAASPASGDLELLRPSGLAPGASDASDVDFEAALGAMGIEGWPTTTVPRTSLLWLRDDAASRPSWKCAGLLLESPEPIERAGRVALTALRLVMQPGVAGAFDIRRTDSTGSRVLWLCSEPFQPKSWEERRGLRPVRRQPSLALELTDALAGTLLRGALQLPTQPSFAEEA